MDQHMMLNLGLALCAHTAANPSKVPLFPAPPLLWLEGGTSAQISFSCKECWLVLSSKPGILAYNDLWLNVPAS